MPYSARSQHHGGDQDETHRYSGYSQLTFKSLHQIVHTSVHIWVSLEYLIAKEMPQALTTENVTHGPRTLTLSHSTKLHTVSAGRRGRTGQPLAVLRKFCTTSFRHHGLPSTIILFQSLGTPPTQPTRYDDAYTTVIPPIFTKLIFSIPFPLPDTRRNASTDTGPLAAALLRGAVELRQLHRSCRSIASRARTPLLTSHQLPALNQILFHHVESATEDSALAKAANARMAEEEGQGAEDTHTRPGQLSGRRVGLEDATLPIKPRLHKSACAIGRGARDDMAQSHGQLGGYQGRVC